MKAKKFAQILSMEFCGGELVLFCHIEAGAAYDAVPAYVATFRLFFRQDGHEQIIGNVTELRSLAQSRDCRLDAWIRGHEGTWARIIAPLLGDFGMVITGELFFTTFEKQLGRVPADHQPRLDGTIFRFSCNDGGPHLPMGYMTIIDIAFDLLSFEYTWDSTNFAFSYA